MYVHISYVLDVADMFLALLQNPRTFIGPGIDNSPVKPSAPATPIGNIIYRPLTTHIADLPAPDDSVTEPESEVDQGVLDAADKVCPYTLLPVAPSGRRWMPNVCWNIAGGRGRRGVHLEASFIYRFIEVLVRRRIRHTFCCSYLYAI
jgi:hypothetical protein